MEHLSNHHVLSSREVDELRELLTDLLVPHEMAVLRKNCNIDASVHSASVGGLDLVHNSFGQGVPLTINTKNSVSGDTLMFNFVTSGGGCVEQNGETLTLTSDLGAVCDGRIPFDGKYHDFSVLLLAVPIEKLENHARNLFGDAVNWMPFRFDQQIDLKTPAGRHLRNTVFYAAEAVDGPLSGGNNPIAISHLEDTLLSCVLATQPNSYMDLYRSRSHSAPLPYHVKRARDFIHAHAARRITASELAAEAGCAYRTLQISFQDAFEMSPMAYLKTVRLQNVRRELSVADNAATVSQVARAWGFVSMSNFAREYQKLFGELPSETLRYRR